MTAMMTIIGLGDGALGVFGDALKRKKKTRGETENSIRKKVNNFFCINI